MSNAALDFSSVRTNLDLDVASVFAERESERYALHVRYMNEMMVRVLRTIGYDVGFRSGKGPYLFDGAGARYLDLLSGWGVFGIGRNHPRLREALASVLASDFPNLVQMDVSPLAGVLAERLLGYAPFLEKVCFANSGSEAVEASVKFSRKATGRPGLVYCAHAFHGLSYGALSVSSETIFRDGFGPLFCQTALVFRLTISRRSSRRSRPGRRPPLSSSQFRARASTFPMTTFSLASSIFAANMEPCSLLTRSRPGSAAQAVFWRSITGASNLTWFSFPKLSRAVTSPWRRCWLANGYWTRSSIAWSAR